MLSAGLSESQLEAALTARGSNYSLMKKTHLTHKANEERLVREVCQTRDNFLKVILGQIYCQTLL